MFNYSNKQNVKTDLSGRVSGNDRNYSTRDVDTPVWANANTPFITSKQTKTIGRQSLCHTLDNDPANANLAYEEHDARFPCVARSLSSEYIFIHTTGMNNQE